MRLSSALSVVSALAAALVMMAAPSAAQVRTAFPEKRGVKLTDFPRTIKLADNVYGYEDIRSPGFTTVSLFVVGTDGVLDRRRAGQRRRDEEDARRDRQGHAEAHQVVHRRIGSRRSHGRQCGPAEGHHLHRLDGLEAADEAGGAGDDRRPEVINIGGIEVQALYLGRAHTGGDLLVYLPKQKILFMSEVYLNRVFPAMRSAYPTEWVGVIDRALKMDVDRYVPGHGFIEEPKASREELVEYQKAMRAVIAEVNRLHKLGLSAEDAAKQAELGTVQGVVPGGAAGADCRAEDLRRDRGKAEVMAEQTFQSHAHRPDAHGDRLAARDGRR